MVICRKLEVNERSLWPENGLNLADTVISILENVAIDFSEGIFDL